MAFDAQSFNQIPVNVLRPGSAFEIDPSNATRGRSAQRFKTLLIGQKLATGTATVNVPVRVLSKDHALKLFGVGSMLASQAASYIDNDRTMELWAVPLADLPAGEAATGTITYTGAPTEAGTLEHLIAGQKVRVGVTAGQTATQVATAVAAAINALTSLPVTAASAAGVVTVTARHKGLASNGLDLRINHYDGQTTPAGLTVAHVNLAGGTGNPDVTAAFAAIGDAYYSTIVHPYTDTANLVVVEGAVRDRADAMRAIDGIAITAKVDTFANLLSLGEGRNSPYNPIIGLSGAPQPAWEIGAMVAAQMAFSVAIDPAVPFQTLLLKGAIPPRIEDALDDTEREFLLKAGISTTYVAEDGTLRIERLLTTYKTNANGIADVALRDVNALLTLYRLRYDLRALIGLKFPRHKLGSDGVEYGPNARIVTPHIIRMEIIALAQRWVDQGLIENLDQFIAELQVTRSTEDVNTVLIFLPPDLINQLIRVHGQLQFIL